jgi:hypothetical protein
MNRWLSEFISRVYDIPRHYCPIFANELKCPPPYKILLITVLICFFLHMNNPSVLSTKLRRDKISLLLWLRGKEVVKM